MSGRGATVARWVAAALLGGAAVAELLEVPVEWRAAAAAMQHAVVVGQAGMIVAGFAGARAPVRPVAAPH